MNNTKPISVAYVIDNFAKGGAQTALIHLVRYLSKKNYKQRIYVLNNIVHPDNNKFLLECANVEIRIIGKVQLLVGIGLIRILCDFISWKPTIVLTMLFYSDILGRIIAKIANIPIIVSSIRAKNIDKAKWQFFLDKITVWCADRIIFNSRQVMPFAIKYEGVQEKQVVYIPNGVNIKLDKSKYNRFKKREELGISNNTLVLGSIGRLRPQKGFYYLLESINLLSKEFSNLLLLIIGSGPLLKDLQIVVTEINLSDKVSFLGERTDIAELLFCMDIYVQASLFEGMSNTVMEAMAMGIPVIATSVDGTIQLIEEGKTGWLVEPKNSTMLAEKISYVLKHPNQAKGVGIAAAKKMAQDFSIEKMGESYDTLFRELVSDKLIT
ncbi:MAG: glycosyltransferase [Thioploca sp.]|nr:glycosyltransferase [Thioploca sp.]